MQLIKTKNLDNSKATLYKLGGRWLGVSKVVWSNAGCSWLLYFFGKTYIVLEQLP